MSLSIVLNRLFMSNSELVRRAVIVELVPFSLEITAIISKVWPEAPLALISTRSSTGATVLIG